MSAPEANDDDRIREELVAYLDGELSHEEALAVESRLGADERYRREMQSLERTWNALDELPPITVGESFTKTTIEMTAAEAKQDVARMSATLPVRRRRRRLAMLVGAAAATVLAFAAVRAAVTYPDRQIARQLPLVLQADALAQARDVEFLRMLSGAPFELVADFSGEKTQDDARTWTELADSGTDQRMHWVRQLSETDKARLLDATRRFDQLPEAERTRLRDEHRALEDAEDSPHLRQAALAYYSWLSTQTPAAQSQLRQIGSNQKRLDKVASLWKEQMDDLRRSLPAEDARALRAALRTVADTPELNRVTDAHIERVEERIRERERERRDERRRDRDDRGRRDQKWDDRDRDDRGRGGHERRDRRDRERHARRWDPQVWRHPALRVAQLQLLATFGDSGFLARLYGDSWDKAHAQARADWGVIEPKLRSALSDQVNRLLDRLDERERGRRITSWVVNAAGDALTDVDLDAFFASDLISDAERNEILALPPDEMEERLRQWYVERELRGADPSEVEAAWRPWGRGRRGDDDRDRRDERRDDDNRQRARDDGRNERRAPPPGPSRSERRGPELPPTGLDF